MSGDPGSLPSAVLQLSVAASAIGAFIGGYTLMHPTGSAVLTGISIDKTEPSGVRALGGALLVGHAAALAALAQSPAIGSCLAAGLGSAWFGAAAGRAIAAVVERRRGPKMLLRILFEGLVGALLWGPLWHYLRLIRHGALQGSV